ncbi:mucin-17-like isoform X2 [Nematostella vectensis]|uniref:mucin-17-like isoform X2 n=1 Tax=Nematostella vectensis TaxID=45351 RepID=UPI0020777F70|nr:mucin-17-like isoform X2 [Nematostella vectensis]
MITPSPNITSYPSLMTLALGNFTSATSVVFDSTSHNGTPLVQSITAPTLPNVTINRTREANSTMILSSTSVSYNTTLTPAPDVASTAPTAISPSSVGNMTTLVSSVNLTISSLSTTLIPSISTFILSYNTTVIATPDTTRFVTSTISSFTLNESANPTTSLIQQNITLITTKAVNDTPRTTSTSAVVGTMITPSPNIKSYPSLMTLKLGNFTTATSVVFDSTSHNATPLVQSITAPTSPNVTINRTREANSTMILSSTSVSYNTTLTPAPDATSTAPTAISPSSVGNMTTLVSSVNLTRSSLSTTLIPSISTSILSYNTTVIATPDTTRFVTSTISSFTLNVSANPTTSLIQQNITLITTKAVNDTSRTTSTSAVVGTMITPSPNITSYPSLMTLELGNFTTATSVVFDSTSHNATPLVQSITAPTLPNVTINRTREAKSPMILSSTSVSYNTTLTPAPDAASTAPTAISPSSVGNMTTLVSSVNLTRSSLSTTLIPSIRTAILSYNRTVIVTPNTTRLVTSKISSFTVNVSANPTTSLIQQNITLITTKAVNDTSRTTSTSAVVGTMITPSPNITSYPSLMTLALGNFTSATSVVFDSTSHNGTPLVQSISALTSPNVRINRTTEGNSTMILSSTSVSYNTTLTPAPDVASTAPTAISPSSEGNMTTLVSSVNLTRSSLSTTLMPSISTSILSYNTTVIATPDTTRFVTSTISSFTLNVSANPTTSLIQQNITLITTKAVNDTSRTTSTSAVVGTMITPSPNIKSYPSLMTLELGNFTTATSVVFDSTSHNATPLVQSITAPTSPNVTINRTREANSTMILSSTSVSYNTTLTPAPDVASTAPTAISPSSVGNMTTLVSSVNLTISSLSTTLIPSISTFILSYNTTVIATPDTTRFVTSTISSFTLNESANPTTSLIQQNITLITTKAVNDTPRTTSTSAVVGTMITPSPNIKSYPSLMTLKLGNFTTATSVVFDSTSHNATPLVQSITAPTSPNVTINRTREANSTMILSSTSVSYNTTLTPAPDATSTAPTAISPSSVGNMTTLVSSVNLTRSSLSTTLIPSISTSILSYNTTVIATPDTTRFVTSTISSFTLNVSANPTTSLIQQNITLITTKAVNDTSRTTSTSAVVGTMITPSPNITSYPSLMTLELGNFTTATSVVFDSTSHNATPLVQSITAPTLPNVTINRTREAKSPMILSSTSVSYNTTLTQAPDAASTAPTAISPSSVGNMTTLVSSVNLTRSSLSTTLIPSIRTAILSYNRTVIVTPNTTRLVTSKISSFTVNVSANPTTSLIQQNITLITTKAVNDTSRTTSTSAVVGTMITPSPNITSYPSLMTLALGNFTSATSVVFDSTSHNGTPLVQSISALTSPNIRINRTTEANSTMILSSTSVSYNTTLTPAPDVASTAPTAISPSSVGNMTTLVSSVNLTRSSLSTTLMPSISTSILSYNTTVIATPDTTRFVTSTISSFTLNVSANPTTSLIQQNITLITTKAVNDTSRTTSTSAVVGTMITPSPNIKSYPSLMTLELGNFTTATSVVFDSTSHNATPLVQSITAPTSPNVTINRTREANSTMILSSTSVSYNTTLTPAPDVASTAPTAISPSSVGNMTTLVSSVNLTISSLSTTLIPSISTFILSYNTTVIATPDTTRFVTSTISSFTLNESANPTTSLIQQNITLITTKAVNDTPRTTSTSAVVGTMITPSPNIKSYPSLMTLKLGNFTTATSVVFDSTSHNATPLVQSITAPTSPNVTINRTREANSTMILSSTSVSYNTTLTPAPDATSTAPTAISPSSVGNMTTLVSSVNLTRSSLSTTLIPSISTSILSYNTTVIATPDTTRFVTSTISSFTLNVSANPTTSLIQQNITLITTKAVNDTSRTTSTSAVVGTMITPSPNITSYPSLMTLELGNFTTATSVVFDSTSHNATPLVQSITAPTLPNVTINRTREAKSPMILSSTSVSYNTTLTPAPDAASTAPTAISPSSVGNMTTLVSSVNLTRSSLSTTLIPSIRTAILSYNRTVIVTPNTTRLVTSKISSFTVNVSANPTTSLIQQNITLITTKAVNDTSRTTSTSAVVGTMITPSPNITSYPSLMTLALGNFTSATSVVFDSTSHNGTPLVQSISALTSPNIRINRTTEANSTMILSSTSVSYNTTLTPAPDVASTAPTAISPSSVGNMTTLVSSVNLTRSSLSTTLMPSISTSILSYNTTVIATPDTTRFVTSTISSFTLNVSANPTTSLIQQNITLITTKAVNDTSRTTSTSAVVGTMITPSPNIKSYPSLMTLELGNFTTATSVVFDSTSHNATPLVQSITAPTSPNVTINRTREAKSTMILSSTSVSYNTTLTPAPDVASTAPTAISPSSVGNMTTLVSSVNLTISSLSTTLIPSISTFILSYNTTVIATPDTTRFVTSTISSFTLNESANPTTSLIQQNITLITTKAVNDTPRTTSTSAVVGTMITPSPNIKSYPSLMTLKLGNFTTATSVVFDSTSHNATPLVQSITAPTSPNVTINRTREAKSPMILSSTSVSYNTTLTPAPDAASTAPTAISPSSVGNMTTLVSSVNLTRSSLSTTLIPSIRTSILSYNRTVIVTPNTTRLVTSKISSFTVNVSANSTTSLIQQNITLITTMAVNDTSRTTSTSAVVGTMITPSPNITSYPSLMTLALGNFTSVTSVIFDSTSHNGTPPVQSISALTSPNVTLNRTTEANNTMMLPLTSVSYNTTLTLAPDATSTATTAISPSSVANMTTLVSSVNLTRSSLSTTLIPSISTFILSYNTTVIATPDTTRFVTSTISSFTLNVSANPTTSLIQQNITLITTKAVNDTSRTTSTSAVVGTMITPSPNVKSYPSLMTLELGNFTTATSVVFDSTSHNATPLVQSITAPTLPNVTINRTREAKSPMILSSTSVSYNTTLTPAPDAASTAPTAISLSSVGNMTTLVSSVNLTRSSLSTTLIPSIRTSILSYNRTVIVTPNTTRLVTSKISSFTVNVSANPTTSLIQQNITLITTKAVNDTSRTTSTSAVVGTMITPSPNITSYPSLMTLELGNFTTASSVVFDSTSHNATPLVQSITAPTLPNVTINRTREAKSPMILSSTSVSYNTTLTPAPDAASTAPTAISPSSVGNMTTLVSSVNLTRSSLSTTLIPSIRTAILSYNRTVIVTPNTTRLVTSKISSFTVNVSANPTTSLIQQNITLITTKAVNDTSRTTSTSAVVGTMITPSPNITSYPSLMTLALGNFTSATSVVFDSTSHNGTPLVQSISALTSPNIRINRTTEANSTMILSSTSVSYNTTLTPAPDVASTAPTAISPSSVGNMTTLVSSVNLTRSSLSTTLMPSISTSILSYNTTVIATPDTTRFVTSTISSFTLNVSANPTTSLIQQNITLITTKAVNDTSRTTSTSAVVGTIITPSPNIKSYPSLMTLELGNFTTATSVVFDSTSHNATPLVQSITAPTSPNDTINRTREAKSTMILSSTSVSYNTTLTPAPDVASTAPTAISPSSVGNMTTLVSSVNLTRSSLSTTLIPSISTFILSYNTTVIATPDTTRFVTSTISSFTLNESANPTTSLIQQNITLITTKAVNDTPRTTSTSAVVGTMITPSPNIKSYPSLMTLKLGNFTTATSVVFDSTSHNATPLVQSITAPTSPNDTINRTREAKSPMILSSTSVSYNTTLTPAPDAASTAPTAISPSSVGNMTTLVSSVNLTRSSLSTTLIPSIRTSILSYNRTVIVTPNTTRLVTSKISSFTVNVSANSTTSLIQQNITLITTMAVNDTSRTTSTSAVVGTMITPSPNITSYPSLMTLALGNFTSVTSVIFDSTSHNGTPPVQSISALTSPNVTLNRTTEANNTMMLPLTSVSYNTTLTLAPDATSTATTAISPSSVANMTTLVSSVNLTRSSLSTTLIPSISTSILSYNTTVIATPDTTRFVTSTISSFTLNVSANPTTSLIQQNITLITTKAVNDTPRTTSTSAVVGTMITPSPNITSYPSLMTLKLGNFTTATSVVFDSTSNNATPLVQSITAPTSPNVTINRTTEANSTMILSSTSVSYNTTLTPAPDAASTATTAISPSSVGNMTTLVSSVNLTRSSLSTTLIPSISTSILSYNTTVIATPDTTRFVTSTISSFTLNVSANPTTSLIQQNITLITTKAVNDTSRTTSTSAVVGTMITPSPNIKSYPSLMTLELGNFTTATSVVFDSTSHNATPLVQSITAPTLPNVTINRTREAKSPMILSSTSVSYNTTLTPAPDAASTAPTAISPSSVGNMTTLVSSVNLTRSSLSTTLIPSIRTSILSYNRTVIVTPNTTRLVTSKISSFTVNVSANPTTSLIQQNITLITTKAVNDTSRTTSTSAVVGTMITPSPNITSYPSLMTLALGNFTSATSVVFDSTSHNGTPLVQSISALTSPNVRINRTTEANSAMILSSTSVSYNTTLTPAPDVASTAPTAISPSSVGNMTTLVSSVNLTRSLLSTTLIPSISTSTLSYNTTVIATPDTTRFVTSTISSFTLNVSANPTTSLIQQNITLITTKAVNDTSRTTSTSSVVGTMITPSPNITSYPSLMTLALGNFTSATSVVFDSTSHNGTPLVQSISALTSPNVRINRTTEANSTMILSSTSVSYNTTLTPAPDAASTAPTAISPSSVGNMTTLVSSVNLTRSSLSTTLIPSIRTSILSYNRTVIVTPNTTRLVTSKISSFTVNVSANPTTSLIQQNITLITTKAVNDTSRTTSTSAVVGTMITPSPNITSYPSLMTSALGNFTSATSVVFDSTSHNGTPLVQSISALTSPNIRINRTTEANSTMILSSTSVSYNTTLTPAPDAASTAPTAISPSSVGNMTTLVSSVNLTRSSLSTTLIPSIRTSILSYNRTVIVTPNTTRLVTSKISSFTVNVSANSTTSLIQQNITLITTMALNDTSRTTSTSAVVGTMITPSPNITSYPSLMTLALGNFTSATSVVFDSTSHNGTPLVQSISALTSPNVRINRTTEANSTMILSSTSVSYNTTLTPAPDVASTAPTAISPSSVGNMTTLVSSVNLTRSSLSTTLIPSISTFILSYNTTVIATPDTTRFVTSTISSFTLNVSANPTTSLIQQNITLITTKAVNDTSRTTSTSAVVGTMITPSPNIKSYPSLMTLELGNFTTATSVVFDSTSNNATPLVQSITAPTSPNVTINRTREAKSPMILSSTSVSYNTTLTPAPDAASTAPTAISPSSVGNMTTLVSSVNLTRSSLSTTLIPSIRTSILSYNRTVIVTPNTTRLVTSKISSFTVNVSANSTTSLIQQNTTLNTTMALNDTSRTTSTSAVVGTMITPSPNITSYPSLMTLALGNFTSATSVVFDSTSHNGTPLVQSISALTSPNVRINRTTEANSTMILSSTSVSYNTTLTPAPDVASTAPTAISPSSVGNMTTLVSSVNLTRSSLSTTLIPSISTFILSYNTTVIATPDTTRFVTSTISSFTLNVSANPTTSLIQQNITLITTKAVNDTPRTTSTSAVVGTMITPSPNIKSYPSLMTLKLGNFTTATSVVFDSTSHNATQLVQSITAPTSPNVTINRTREAKSPMILSSTSVSYNTTLTPAPDVASTAPTAISPSSVGNMTTLVSSVNLTRSSLSTTLIPSIRTSILSYNRTVIVTPNTTRLVTSKISSFTVNVSANSTTSLIQQNITLITTMAVNDTSRTTSTSAVVGTMITPSPNITSYPSLMTLALGNFTSVTSVIFDSTSHNGTPPVQSISALTSPNVTLNRTTEANNTMMLPLTSVSYNTTLTLAPDATSTATTAISPSSVANMTTLVSSVNLTRSSLSTTLIPSISTSILSYNTTVIETPNTTRFVTSTILSFTVNVSANPTTSLIQPNITLITTMAVNDTSRTTPTGAVVGTMITPSPNITSYPSLMTLALGNFPSATSVVFDSTSNNATPLVQSITAPTSPNVTINRTTEANSTMILSSTSVSYNTTLTSAPDAASTSPTAISPSSVGNMTTLVSSVNLTRSSLSTTLIPSIRTAILSYNTTVIEIPNTTRLVISKISSFTVNVSANSTTSLIQPNITLITTKAVNDTSRTTSPSAVVGTMITPSPNITSYPSLMTLALGNFTSATSVVFDSTSSYATPLVQSISAPTSPNVTLNRTREANSTMILSPTSVSYNTTLPPAPDATSTATTAISPSSVANMPTLVSSVNLTRSSLSTTLIPSIRTSILSYNTTVIETPNTTRLVTSKILSFTVNVSANSTTSLIQPNITLITTMAVNDTLGTTSTGAVFATTLTPSPNITSYPSLVTLAVGNFTSASRVVFYSTTHNATTLVPSISASISPNVTINRTREANSTIILPSTSVPYNTTLKPAPNATSTSATAISPSFVGNMTTLVSSVNLSRSSLSTTLIPSISTSILSYNTTVIATPNTTRLVTSIISSFTLNVSANWMTSLIESTILATVSSFIQPNITLFTTMAVNDTFRTTSISVVFETIITPSPNITSYPSLMTSAVGNFTSATSVVLYSTTHNATTLVPSISASISPNVTINMTTEANSTMILPSTSVSYNTTLTAAPNATSTATTAISPSSVANMTTLVSSVNLTRSSLSTTLIPSISTSILSYNTTVIETPNTTRLVTSKISSFTVNVSANSTTSLILPNITLITTMAVNDTSRTTSTSAVVGTMITPSPNITSYPSLMTLALGNFTRATSVVFDSTSNNATPLVQSISAPTSPNVTINRTREANSTMILPSTSVSYNTTLTPAPDETSTAATAISPSSVANMTTLVSSVNLSRSSLSTTLIPSISTSILSYNTTVIATFNTTRLVTSTISLSTVNVSALSTTSSIESTTMARVASFIQPNVTSITTIKIDDTSRTPSASVAFETTITPSPNVTSYQPLLMTSSAVAISTRAASIATIASSSEHISTWTGSLALLYTERLTTRAIPADSASSLAARVTFVVSFSLVSSFDVKVSSSVLPLPPNIAAMTQEQTFFGHHGCGDYRERSSTRAKLREKFRRAIRMVQIFSAFCIGIRRYAEQEKSTQYDLYYMRDMLPGNEDVPTPVQESSLYFNKHLFSRNNTLHFPLWARWTCCLAPEDRKEAEISKLVSLLRGMKSFNKFSREAQLKLCRTMTYACYERRRIIVRQGHPGFCFYFIVSGTVSVTVTRRDFKTGNRVDVGRRAEDGDNRVP